jgi:hypothetical protein
MKEPTPTTPTGEPEETLVTPRFDDVETVQAQPVVPLTEVPPGATRGRSFDARRFASWPVALVLVSALVGVVVGGAGLYFYQNRSAADTQPQNFSAEATIAAPSFEGSAPAQGVEETAAAEVVEAEVVEPVAPAVSDDDAKKEEADKPSAPEPRKAAERDDDNMDSSKRGKKVERDAEPEPVRRTPRAERVASREQARGDGDSEPQARLSDEIIYRRERRAERQAERRERRANRQRSVDRVRGIFEGQPE